MGLGDRWQEVGGWQEFQVKYHEARLLSFLRFGNFVIGMVVENNFRHLDHNLSPHPRNC